MTSSNEIREQLLRDIGAATNGALGTELDVRALPPRAGIARRRIYAAVLSLCDEGYLEYVGAGPRVRLTPEGARAAQQVHESVG